MIGPVPTGPVTGVHLAPAAGGYGGARGEGPGGRLPLLGRSPWGLAAGGHVLGDGATRPAGRNLVPLSLDKQDEIRFQTLRSDWTAVPVPNAKARRLDGEALAKAREEFARKHPGAAAGIAGWDTEEFLERAHLRQTAGSPVPRCCCSATIRRRGRSTRTRRRPLGG